MDQANIQSLCKFYNTLKNIQLCMTSLNLSENASIHFNEDSKQNNGDLIMILSSILNRTEL